MVRPGGLHPVAPGAEDDRYAVPETDLVLDVDAKLLLRFAGRILVEVRNGQRVVIDAVEIDDIVAEAAALPDVVPAIVEAEEHGVLDRKSVVEGTGCDSTGRYGGRA